MGGTRAEYEKPFMARARAHKFRFGSRVVYFTETPPTGTTGDLFSPRRPPPDGPFKFPVFVYVVSVRARARANIKRPPSNSERRTLFQSRKPIGSRDGRRWRNADGIGTRAVTLTLYSPYRHGAAPCRDDGVGVGDGGEWGVERRWTN